MPIPLLFMGIGAITAIAGVGNTIKAGIDQSDANDINEEANDIIEDRKKLINTVKTVEKRLILWENAKSAC